MTTANTTVELFTLGALTGNIFLELQYVFQMYTAEMGTPVRDLTPRAIQVLSDRGFIADHIGCNGRPNGVQPSDKALAGLYLENATGGRCNEPRDAFDGRLVADVPEWAEQPTRALGVAL